MEGSKFKKLCADCGLVDKKFTVTDVDLTFSKVMTKRQSIQQTLRIELLLVFHSLPNLSYSVAQGQDKGHSEDHLCRV